LGAVHLVSLEEGKTVDSVRDKVMEQVRAAFRPEFLNRLDEILLFRRLDKAHMLLILDIQLRNLHKLLHDRRITLDLDKNSKKWLAEKGYDPAYGARPLKRAIQTYLQNRLAELILQGDVLDDSTVNVSVKNDELIFKIKVAKSVPESKDKHKRDVA